MQPAPRSTRPSTRAAGRAGLLLALVFGLALLVAVGVWLRLRSGAGTGDGGGPGGVETPADPQTQRLRELAAAYFAKDSRSLARETLGELVGRPDAAPRDLIAAAIVELSEVRLDEARALLERAAARGGRSPELDYNLARVAYYEFEFEEAARRLRAVREALPGDVPTRLFLGQVLEEIATQAQRPPAEAEALYREVVALGPDEAGGTWYFTAIYRLAMLLQRDEREDEAAELFDEWEALKARGFTTPSPRMTEEGNLGRLLPPPPRGNLPGGPGALPRFDDARQVVPELSGRTDALLADLDEDCRLDVVAWGPAGLGVALQADGFAWSGRTLVDGPVDLALAFDLGNDGDLDLLYARGSELALLEAFREDPRTPDEPVGPIAWRPYGGSLPALPSAPLQVVPVDYDHEGDLDLALVGAFGLRLWRNDGADAQQAGGAFTDATAEAGVALDARLAWCVIEDLDTDQDVDLLLGGPDALALLSNERGGRFSDASERLEGLGTFAAAPLVADLDGDARPDLWAADRLFRSLPSGRYDAGTAPSAALQPPPAGSVLRTGDLDLDGSLDVFWLDGPLLRGRQSVGLPSAAAFELDPAAASAPRAVLFADLDGDLSGDLVLLGDEALEVRRGEAAGRAVRLAYRGQKDNRLAVGAVVELRADGVYRRIFWRGVAELVGVGTSDQVDYVRVLWPNGVTQYDLRHATGDRACDLGAAEAFQPDGLVGSCPFLYTWNGERYEFISDVLGITPLGLPMAPGMLVPPDHDEYVLVRGEQLQPRDGVLELQFTEELREVTYLDRIRLDVVDHPAGSEVFPNERFCFPPFPEARIHTVEAPLAPRRALDGAGRDWSAALAAIDGEHAVPFELVPSQMLGLATPHFLELEFDREAVAAAPQLRLLMTGWFYWTDASVNMASARDPRYEFVPPILQVPDGQGGWRPIGPPVGFPAGKTKTMVLDVSEHLVRDDPRVRVFGTLRLYWDAIRLATDSDTTPLALRSLEPTSARLWRRGFSAPLDDGRANQPERFEWERLAAVPRWNPHPGLYTKLGECLPLVQEVDDMFAILASGDALTVQFDAAALPPLPQGWRRDYLVFLDGWAKDRDPNTHEALYVEPLPFHGMSGYPYGEDERFPDTPAHRAWRREWNTRDAQPWIPFQAPPQAPFPSLLER